MARRNVAENTVVRAHPVLVILTVTIIFLTVAAAVLFPFARDAYAAKRELDGLGQELEAGEALKRQFEQKLEELKTDEGIEDQAHSLGLVRPGEKPVIITGLDEPESPAASSGMGMDGCVPPPKSWWEEWLDALFGITPYLPPQPSGSGQAGSAQADGSGSGQ